ncbi:putative ribonuclease H-like domain-containing protein, partial [Tanacetum coccineum]
MVAFLQKPTGSEQFHQIVDFLAGSHIRYALTANPTIYVSLIEQFWHTVTVDTVNDGEQQLTVIVDGQTIAITEVFDQLTLMGYVSNDDKLTFQKGVHIPLFDTVLIYDQPGQGEGPTLNVESQHTPIASLPTSQPTTSQPMSSQEQPSQVPITEPITDSRHHLPCPMNHHSEKDDLKQTKKIYGKALTKLVKKVKHLEAKLKSTTERRKARMVISDDEEDLVSKDTSKQGRMTETEYEGFTLQQFTPLKVTQGEEQCQESSEAQLSVLSAAKILADASREKVKTYTRRRSTDSSRDSTTGGLFSTAEEVQALELQKQLDEREETNNIDWNTVAEQVQERQSNTIQRYQTLKKKPVSVAQARKNIMIYLKNMAGYMMEETILQESFKKLRTSEASRSEPIQEQPTEEPKELSKEELKKMLEIVPVEETKAEALQVKYPIIDWEIHTEGSRKYWKIIRVETSQRHIKSLKICSKDLTEKTLYMYDPLTWRLYGTCGVHHVSSTRGHDIYMLIEKDYPLSTAVMNLMLSRRLFGEQWPIVEGETQVLKLGKLKCKNEISAVQDVKPHGMRQMLLAMTERKLTHLSVKANGWPVPKDVTNRGRFIEQNLKGEHYGSINNSNIFVKTRGMESGSHLSTLRRLHAWERKLYDEVKIVASEGIRDTRAIASSRAAEIYGPDILTQNVQVTPAYHLCFTGCPVTSNPTILRVRLVWVYGNEVI